MIKKKPFLLGVLLAFAFFLGGCKYAKRFIDRPKLVTLVLGFTESRFSFDWQKELNAPSLLMVTHLMDGLVGYKVENGKAQVIPELAEKWENKSDTVWTFHLRKMQWSDGEELRAEHFANAFRRLLATDSDSPYVDLLAAVKGAREFHDGKVKFFSDVGIKTPDSKTLVFELNSAQPNFLDLLVHPALYPLRNDHLELFAGRKKKINQIPWIGPYRLILLGKRRVQIFENTNYMKVRGNIQKVDFLLDVKREKLVKMLNENKMDMAFGIESLPPLNSVLSLAAPLYSFYQLVVGCAQKPLRDPILRRVIALSINKDELAKSVQESQGISGVIPPGVEGFESNRGMKYDAEMATLVLKNARAESVLSKFSFDLFVDKNFGPQALTLAEGLKDQFKKNLGMEIKIVPQAFVPPTTTSAAAIEKTRPYFILEKVLGKSLNPYYFLLGYGRQAFTARSSWKNREYDQWITKATPARAQHLLVEEENPVIPLISFYSQMVALPSLQGLSQNFLRLVDFRNLVVEAR